MTKSCTGVDYNADGRYDPVDARSSCPAKEEKAHWGKDHRWQGWEEVIFLTGRAQAGCGAAFAAPVDEHDV